MTFAVHVKNGISLSHIREKTQAGLADSEKTNFDGCDMFVGDNGSHARYQKNFARMKGLCKCCLNFVPDKTKTVTGEHCSKEYCVK